MAKQRNKESNTMAGTLDLAAVTEILAGTRGRTNAGVYISDFLSSDELAREVDLNTPSWAGKDAKKVQTALNNARKKVTEDGQFVIPGGKDVAVRVKDGKVFVINTKLVAEAQAKAA